MSGRRHSFFLPMVPPKVTKQMKDIGVVGGKPIVYDTAEMKAAKAKLRDHLGPHRPSPAFQGPVRLITKWCWPCGEKHGDGEYKVTKPDTDNIIGILKDQMEALGFFASMNDACVASEVTEKFWAEVPGIWVCLEELPRGGVRDAG